MKVFGQIVFWVFVVFLLTLVFGVSGGKYGESFYFVSMLLPVVAGTSYYFNEYLVPRYLFTKKIFKFSLYAVYMLIISAWLEVLVITLALVFLANYQYQNMNPVTTNVYVLAVTLYFIVFLYGFIQLVLRAFRNQQTILKLEEEKEKQKMDYLIVRIDRKLNKIPGDEIEYLESLGDYVKIFTSAAAPLVTREKISRLEAKLPENFLRIHRSFLVNSNKIKSFTREEVCLKDNSRLPISRTYKKMVIETLNNYSGSLPLSLKSTSPEK